MAQNEAPSGPQREMQFIDTDTGFLTPYGLSLVDGIWRQISAGFAVVPCDATMASNVITLTPRLHEEGGRTYGDGMTFTFVAPSTSTGAVTAKITAPGQKFLSTIKVMITGGTVQAGTGDVAANFRYLAIYDASADSGNGALVIK